MSYSDMFKSLPPQWQVEKIDNIKCNTRNAIAMGPFGSNITRDNFVDNGVPVIRGNNLKPFYFDESDFVFVTEEKAENLRASIVRRGDIVITHRGTLGQVGYIPSNSSYEKYIVSQSGMKLSCDTSKVNSKFLWYFLNSRDGQHLLLSNASQVGVPSIAQPTTTLKKIPIPVPPLPGQRRIAAILSSLDDKIENNRKTCKKLEEIAQALFKLWFVDFEFPNEDGLPYKSSGGEMVYCEELGKEIPKGWECICLSDVIEFQNGYAFKSNELLKDRTHECYDVFKMGHIKRGGGLNKDGTKTYIEKNKCEHLSKYVLKKGDILMSMTDMKDNVAILGNTALMDENDRYIVNQRVGLIRSSGKYNIDYPFLYFLTNSLSFVEDLRSRANRGVQVNLSTAEIKASKLAIPKNNLGLLRTFDNFGKSTLELNFSKSIEIQNLQHIRDALLPKLMSGELAVEEGEVG